MPMYPKAGPPVATARRMLELFESVQRPHPLVRGQRPAEGSITERTTSSQCKLRGCWAYRPRIMETNSSPQGNSGKMKTRCAERRFIRLTQPYNLLLTPLVDVLLGVLTRPWRTLVPPARPSIPVATPVNVLGRAQSDNPPRQRGHVTLGDSGSLRGHSRSGNRFGQRSDSSAFAAGD